MKYFLTIVAVAIPLTVPAAPRLTPKPCFESANADAYGVLIGPTNIVNTEMKVTFAVRGKKDATYSVELYVEANSTGERAEWLRTATVKADNGSGDEEVITSGEFKVRRRFPDEAVSVTEPHLPDARKASGWTVLLVLKEGKHAVASSGPHAVQLSSRYVHVPK